MLFPVFMHFSVIYDYLSTHIHLCTHFLVICNVEEVVSVLSHALRSGYVQWLRSLTLNVLNLSEGKMLSLHWMSCQCIYHDIIFVFYWSCDFYSMEWQCYKTDSHPNEVLLELFNSLKDLLSWNGWNVINDSVFAFSPHISTLTVVRSNMIHRSHFQVVNLFIK